ncbi:MAG: hypothetical protein LBQ47_02840, partial [Endomicrobium sp.]|nr:hypothetical protein [Endomicrobium sp.]
ALTVQGQTTGGYTKVADKNGNITVFTNSKTIETNFNKLSVTETGAIKGANIFTRIWDGIKQGANYIWNGAKQAASFAWNKIINPVWNGAKKGVAFAWNKIIKPVWNNAIKPVIRVIIQTLAKPFAKVWGFVKGIVDGIIEKTTKDVTGSEKYNNVVDDLAKDTGLDKEYIEAMLAQLDNATLSKAIDVLTELYESGGDIINCGSHTAAALLGVENEGVLAFQLFLIDIQTRPIDLFVKKGQLSTSPYALQTLLNIYGKNADVKAIGASEFMNSLQIGESSALVCKMEGNNFHYIAVTKQVDEESGKIKYVVSDNGKISEFEEEEFRNLLENGSGKDKNDNVVEYDFKFIEFNEIVVISDSQSVKNAGHDEIIEDVLEIVQSTSDASKKATIAVIDFFSGLFGGNKKDSAYETAQKDLKLKQANAIMIVSMFTGVEGMEEYIEKAYQDLAEAEQNMLNNCKTDKQKEDAQINIAATRIDLDIITFKVESKGAIEAANNALDDYISGNITYEEYQTIVDNSMAEINKLAAPIAAKIEALNKKKQAAGHEPDQAQQTAFNDIINSSLYYAQDSIITICNQYRQYLQISTAAEVKLEDIPEDVLTEMLKLFSEEELQSSKIVVVDGNKGPHYYVISESDSSETSSGLTITRSKTFTAEDGAIISISQVDIQNNDYAEKYLNSLKAFDYILSGLIQSYDSLYSNSEEAAAAKAAVLHEAGIVINCFRAVLITMNNAYDNICKKMEGLSPDSDEYIALNEYAAQIETISAQALSIIDNICERFDIDFLSDEDLQKFKDMFSGLL